MSYVAPNGNGVTFRFQLPAGYTPPNGHGITYSFGAGGSDTGTYIPSYTVTVILGGT